MDLDNLAKEALEEFRKKYPFVTSGDLQTFILGFRAAVEGIKTAYVISDGVGKVEAVCLTEKGAIEYVGENNRQMEDLDDMVRYKSVEII